MFRVSMSARGQVVIPVELRRRLHLAPGVRFRLHESGTKLTLVPELSDPIDAGLGFLKRSAAPEEEDKAPLSSPRAEGHDGA